MAWFEAGRLNRAAEAAQAAEAEAGRLGFDRHFFAVDYLRTVAGLALERRDLDTAERLTEQALSIAERRRPMCEFLARLDRARVWAARGQVREALASIEAARQILAGTGSVLLRRADELEALLRLSLGDPRTPAELARRLPPARRSLLLASRRLVGSRRPYVLRPSAGAAPRTGVPPSFRRMDQPMCSPVCQQRCAAQGHSRPFGISPDRASSGSASSSDRRLDGDGTSTGPTLVSPAQG